jgi:hypothetical protein
MKRVTITRTEVVEVSASDAQRIVDAAKRTKYPPERLTVKVETLLDVPERRVIICADDDIGSAMDCDFENDEDREDLERQINSCGVWGFICEERTIVNGKWTHIDSCFSFVGSYDSNRTMFDGMREHMTDDYNTLEPIDEHEAKRMDREEKNT